MSDKPNSRYTTNEDAARTARTIAVVFLAIGLALAYWVWPTGVTDLPMSQITLGALLRVFASGVIALAGLVAFVLLLI